MRPRDFMLPLSHRKIPLSRRESTIVVTFVKEHRRPVEVWHVGCVDLLREEPLFAAGPAPQVPPGLLFGCWASRLLHLQHEPAPKLLAIRLACLVFATREEAAQDGL